ncbi:DNA segregation ATPase FtsK/SpoIIIE, S-DNA-T family [Thermomonospora echinospora]|uniref:DNA segregation ATPase FtsK/SpoIIIE, S-DNA-T family n=1 Tax=Thermomonospora echinospora TaxID=1992 RepID=A0A1H6E064_9ACTN|nr:FtsK/SpoIIIE domain-containing protein [Thermomonospora echinospora]SEG90980.1 DNA segregation ATPase FtsK/SpoIIIE, S-DNA-T family [Thermomonospora echinospora]
MTTNEPMGEVINLPVRPDPAPTTAAPTDADGGARPPFPTAPATSDPDGPGRDVGEVLEGKVLVDQPDTDRPDIRKRMLADTGQRRPIIAPWLRDRNEARATVRWAVGYAGHVTGYHAARFPLYGLRLALRSPRGLWRVVVGTWRWTCDAEAMPLRMHAADRKDADTYLKLLRERDDRVRWRRIMAGAGLAGTGLAAMSVSAAGGITQATVFAAVVAVLGWIGTPSDKRILDTAVVSTKAPKLTSEIVVRALASLGIAEINKAVGKGGGGITFPAPITRDGPGWRADVDLPYGVTVTDIMERRDRLASGLRRPLGCVWPEPAHDQHAGRLVLWVGDQDMNQVKPPVWPLAKTGTADLFKAIPFGTDQRGRPVTLTLMYANMLIGAMPGAGKTFALKVPLLAAALDPTAQLRVFELKGTGDLDFSEKVAHHYGSGPDDTTIGECLASLREVYKELEKRAKTLAGLPKDLRPENKVTPQLAARKSLGLHPLVFVVDECQELFSHPEYGAEAGTLATAIIKRGRALGVILLLATQRPDKDSLPTGVSANVGIRFCLRVMGQLENDMILGTSMYKNGIRATTFTKQDKGIGYLVGEADEPQITRGYYLDGPTADRIADRARAARKAASTLTGYAAGEDTTPTDDGTSLLADIAAVLRPGEDKVWSETIVTRLAELRPGLYTGWTPAQLADALKPYGITTAQVWGQDENGKGANRRGIACEHITAALEATRTDAK